MPRKNAMRDNVSAVRSRLPHLSNLSRDEIELALLHYESNVDETVEAFKRNGAIEALSGWTETNNGRGNNSNKRTNNKSGNRDYKSSSQTPPSNGILRPSQRVSNIFQIFAEGGIPTIATNGNTTMSNTATCSPSSISSSSFLEQSNNSLQTYPSTDLSFHSYLSQDATANNSSSLLNVTESTHSDLHDTSNATTNSSTTTDEINLLTNHLDQDNETSGHNGKPKPRRSLRNRNGSMSSVTLNHDQPISTNIEQSTSITTTVTEPSNPGTSNNNNRKILTKSTKDLQRQTSTLTNVELSFENEMKSSIKQIDDLFKQIREIINEREIELYLEMDKVKEQGLNIIHRRKQRAMELRQRVDRCDRLEPLEIDTLRTDIKQFVTDRRYDLGEELTSSHRFEYDQTLIEGLKTCGTVLRIDRKYDRARTLSTSSALVEQNGTTTNEKVTTEKSTENIQTPLTNGRILSSSPNERTSPNHQQQPLPQRIRNKQKLNESNAGDYYQNSHVSPQTNGYHQYYDESNNYQTANHRRSQPQQYPQYQNGNTRRPRAIPPSNNNNINNNNNNRRNGLNNSETTNTYRRPRPPPPQTIIPPISN